MELPLAAGIIIFLTIVNLFGVKIGEWIANIFGGAKLVGLALILQRQNKQESISDQRRQQQEQLSRTKQTEKKIEDYLQEDELRLELGAKLIPLVDPKTGSDIMKRIGTVRTELASELGILLPMVRIK
ncbi:MAG: FHIPEP family type III secretion protein, partial [bacterium]